MSSYFQEYLGTFFCTLQQCLSPCFALDDSDNIQDMRFYPKNTFLIACVLHNMMYICVITLPAKHSYLNDLFHLFYLNNYLSALRGCISNPLYWFSKHAGITKTKLLCLWKRKMQYDRKYETNVNVYLLGLVPQETCYKQCHDMFLLENIFFTI